MNHHRKVLLITTAALAIGFAFAAQSTDYQDDPGHVNAGRRAWVPGTDTPMSAYESRSGVLAPPQ